MIKQVLREEITTSFSDYPFFPKSVAVFSTPSEPNFNMSGLLFSNDDITYEDEQNSIQFTLEYFSDHSLKVPLQSTSASSHITALFNLCCEEAKNAVFLIKTAVTTKFWVNGSIVSVLLKTDTQMCIVKLQKGINTIAFEQYGNIKNLELFIRISDFGYEKSKNTLPCLFDGEMRYSESSGYVYYNNAHLYNGEPFTFAFYPNNELLGENTYFDFSLEDSASHAIYFSEKLQVKQENSIDVSQWTFHDATNGHYLIACVSYEYANRQTYQKRIPIYTQPVDGFLRNLCNDAWETVQSIDNEYDQYCLKFGLEYILKYGRELGPTLAQATILKQNIAYIKSHKHLESKLYDRGMKRVFFFNPMYNAINCYRVYIPENYTPTRKYPLIIIHSTYEYSSFSSILNKYTKEPVIAADISGRGVLLGSYMGEAAIKIALQDLLKRFSIDTDRIYCTGNSNGGGAAWAQLQSYPDMYAGGFVVSGYANANELCNLRNLRIINMSSPSDETYAQHYVPVDEALRDSPKYTGILGVGFCHNSLHRIWFNERSIDMLLSSRRDRYPNCVEYKTTRNRHRKAYWIEIHSIADGNFEAHVKATVEDCFTISIQCHGITGLSVTIPPQIANEKVDITINNSATFTEHNHRHKTLHYAIDSHGNCSPIDSDSRRLREQFRGNGLLDVFLDPLTIVVPPNPSKELMLVAKTHSEPYCNGFLPKVYVKYPIIEYNDIESSTILAERSLIVIDNGDTTDFLRIIRENAHIKTSAVGWEYQNHTHDEHYCVQQILKSPWNNGRSIVLISYNDESTLKRNLFFRKLVIPTYANGRHKYLNNNALIFNGKSYQGIADYSCAPTQL